jgi:hypothetical protein
MTTNSRTATRAPHVADIFTDRANESVAFKTSLINHRRAIDGPVDPHSARNVLVFYGEGGMGKSSLSARLKLWVDGKLPLDNDGWGPPPATAVAGMVTTDLHGTGSQFELAELLMAIRIQLGSVQRHWKAFDIAFAAYWTLAHPGSTYPLADRGGREVLDATAEVFVDLNGDLQALAGDEALPFPAGAVGLAARLVYAVVDGIRGRRTTRDLLSSYDGFDEILRDCTTLPSSSDPRPDILARVAGLLDAEMTELDEAPLIVVFVDHFERLSADPRRFGERILNEVVWRMPHLLFVMCGRNALTWARASEHAMHASGPIAWPNLVLSEAPDLPEPRQHLVGYLAERDRRQVMRRARTAYDLRMTVGLADEISELSGGRPFHLELLITVAMAAQARGEELRLEVFEGTADELVAKILSDIAPNERRAIRAGALVPYFSAELVAAAAGVDVGAAERAMTQPVIAGTGRNDFPFAMHDEVRRFLLSASSFVDDGWAVADWRSAGSRALRFIREQYARVSADGPSPALLDWVGLAVTVTCLVDAEVEPADSRFYRDWLTKAIVFSPSVAALRSRTPPTAKTAYGTSLLRFIVAKTSELAVEVRIDELREIFESDHAIATPAGRHLGYTLRDVSRWEEAQAVFEQLVERSPSDIHRFQLAATLAIARRFGDALALCDGLNDVSRRNLEASTRMAHGEPHAWLKERRENIARKLEAGKHREYLEATNALMRVRALVTGDVTAEEAEESLAQAEMLGHAAGTTSALATLLLLDPESARPGAARFERLKKLDWGHTGGQLGFRTGLVWMSGAFVRGSRREMSQVAEQIAARRARRSRSWIPTECLVESLDIRIPAQATQWQDPVEVVQMRWREIFDSHRARLSGSR